MFPLLNIISTVVSEAQINANQFFSQIHDIHVLSANSKSQSVKLFIVQKETTICQCTECCETFNHNLQISYRFVWV